MSFNATIVYPYTMNPLEKMTSEEKAPVVRRTGRRPRGDGSGAPDLSRDLVIQCAVALARRESISELSMVGLAREMKVAPGLIHYYMRSRVDLVSAVMNFAFKERMEALPPIEGSWRTDLEGVARSTMKTIARWPGLATYIGTHNRFRLFQRVQSGELDYGLAYFDHVGRILQNGGFSKQQAALAYHLLMLFVMSMAAEQENCQAPGEHEDFIVGYVSEFEHGSIPGASYIVQPFAKLDNATTFEAGLSLLMDGFQSWHSKGSAADPMLRRKK